MFGDVFCVLRYLPVVDEMKWNARRHLPSCTFAHTMCTYCKKRETLVYIASTSTTNRFELHRCKPFQHFFILHLLQAVETASTAANTAVPCRITWATALSLKGGWLTWPPGFGCAGNQPSVVMIEGGTYSNQSCVEIARWLWLTWFSGCQRDCRCRVAIPTINCSGSIILMPFSLKQIQFVSANWDTYHSSLHWFLQTSKMCLRYSKYVIQHTRGATIVHDSVLKARMNFILAVLLNVRPYYLPRLVSVSASSKFFGIGCVMKYEKQSSFLWLCCLETVCSSTMFSGVVFC